MIRIACFSDTHGQHKSKKLQEWFDKNSGDILIYAGDYQLNNFDDGTDFLHWISTTNYRKKVIVFGNHDGNYDILTTEAEKLKDIVILNQGFAKVFGINIFGSPYSPKFLDWWFMKSEPELEQLYAKIPKNTEILITHTPVFGILDEATNGYSLGSWALEDRIKELKKLKYHICGHVHEAHGKYKNGRITYFNGSILDESYKVANFPITFNY